MLFTWEMIVEIPPHPGNGMGRHLPPPEALRFGHRRVTARVRTARSLLAGRKIAPHSTS